VRLSRIRFQNYSGFADDRVRRKFYLHGQTVTAEPQTPCVIECQGVFDEEQGSWARELTSIEGRTTRQEANWLRQLAERKHHAVQAGMDCPLPVIAYYGTGRLWVQLSKTKVRTLSPGTRFQGYLDCLNPASNEQMLVEWFKTNELAAIQQRAKIDVLEACRQAICDCVPEAQHVAFDVGLDQLVIALNGERVPFHYLSDGYRNMLAIAADIAVRCATLNPHLRNDAARLTAGLVLIDEIDLHLHPNWQRRVVADLMRAFPKIQFIATTHSPFVIQSLPATEGVRLVNLDDAKRLDFHDKSVEDIAEWVQGVPLPQRSQRFLDMMEHAENPETLVIVRRFRADRFLPVEQQQRLQSLMKRWREARDQHGESLSEAEQAELDSLVEAELEATAGRASAIAEGL
jgi:predicted ATP-binding protein involved in virulence